MMNPQDIADLSSERQEFAQLSALPQAERGLAFQGFLFRLFEKYGLDPSGSFRKSQRGIQHDDAISLQGTRYLVEERWSADPIGPRVLLAFSALIRRALVGTRGLYISISGFTNTAIDELQHEGELRLILMDGNDLAAVLAEEISLTDLLVQKAKEAALRGRAMLPVNNIHARAGSDPFAHFCNLIGLKDEIRKEQSRYWRLRDLFVPPEGFDQIMHTLEEEHVVVITGDPHIGKTYTALYVLWVLYDESGVRPKWATATTIARELDSGVLNSRILLDKYMLENGALYLEDPFGMLGATSSEWFKKDMTEILTEAKRRNTRLIITTRHNVLKDSLGAFDERYIVHLEQHLKLNEAYSPDRLRRIAQNYLALYDPPWASGESTSDVAGAIANALPCPHNIQLFVRGTMRSTDRDAAFGSIETYRDVTRELARWILSLSPQHRVFLLIAKDFALQRDPPLLWAKSIFAGLFQGQGTWEEVERQLSGTIVRRPFDPELLALYEDVPPDAWDDMGWVPTFSHPVYIEALHLAAEEDDTINEEFVTVLQAYANFEDKILFDQTTTEIVREFALEMLFWYGPYERLPFVSITAEVSFELIKKFAEGPNIAFRVAVFANLLFLIDSLGPKTTAIVRQLWDETILADGKRFIERLTVQPGMMLLETDSDGFYLDLTEEQYRLIVDILQLSLDDDGRFDWDRS